jgi:hypothetical protein
MSKEKEEIKKFKPRFLGFTQGMKEGETMAEFVKRVNKEGKGGDR